VKQEALKERVELLEIGEALGYPRLGYGRSTKIPHDKRIPAGKDGWEKFTAHAHVTRLLPALRIGRVLRDNGVVPFHPPSGRDLAPPEDRWSFSIPVAASNTVTLNPTVEEDILADIALDSRPTVVAVKTSDAPPRVQKGGHKRRPRG
jgi:hypothetical protein